MGETPNNMRQRLLSAAVGLLLVLLILLGFYNISFLFVVSALGALAVYELLDAVKLTRERPLTLLACLAAAAIPFSTHRNIYSHETIALTLYVFLLLLYLLVRHEQVKIKEICYALVVSLLVPFAFSTMIFMREKYPEDGLFYLCLILIGSWVADAGAYFVGTFLGKHKLCPSISPNKTVEGTVGALASNMAGMVLAGLVYQYLTPGGEGLELSYLNLALIGLMCAVVSILGDLTASVIKRQSGIKDYGKIIPGHGGIMDRCDSLLFVAPFFYLIIRYLPIVLR